MLQRAAAPSDRVRVGGVVPIDVIEQLDVAVPLRPGSEIHNVDRHFLTQRDVFLLAGVHGFPDPAIAPRRAVPQDVAGQLFRTVQPDAAVAERASFARKEAVGRGVVQIHVEGIREQEFHVSQRVHGAGLLAKRQLLERLWIVPVHG